MPPLRYPILAALLASLLISTVAIAAKPATTCPAPASAYFVVDGEQWWDITVAGFEAAGIDVYEDDLVTFTDAFNEFAASAGFGDGAGLETFVRVDQWAQIDKNQNDFVCMKRRPITPGNPAYFFNGVDDQASAPSGESA